MTIQEEMAGNFHHSPKKIKWDEIHESIDLVKWDDGKCLFGHFDEFGNRLFTPIPKLNFPNCGFSSEFLFYRKDSYTSTDRALLPKPDHPKSLRDEFAMSALSGLMFTKKILHPMGNSDASYLAKMAYQIADAMMEERK